MKISKKLVIILSIVLIIGAIISVTIIKFKQEKTKANEINNQELDVSEICKEQNKEQNNEHIAYEEVDSITEEVTQTKDESVEILNTTSNNENKVEQKDKQKQIDTSENKNKTSISSSSNAKTEKQSNNTSKEQEQSKKEETEVGNIQQEESKVPENEPANPVEPEIKEEIQENMKQEDEKQEEVKIEENKTIETKPVRTYKINKTYINKLRETIVTEVTNNLEKLNKYGITSVEKYTIIEDDSICTFNGGHRSGWTYENPSAFATFKSSILKGKSMKIYAVDEYYNGEYIQTLCYYGH